MRRERLQNTISFVGGGAPRFYIALNPEPTTSNYAQILVNMIDFGMNLQEAGDAPRIRHIGSSQPTGTKMLDGGTVRLESGFDYDEVRKLIRKGHRVQSYAGGYGGYQAILFDEENGVYYGASESRKDGHAAGY